MKDELKKIITDLFLANNLDKVNNSKNAITNYIDKIDDKVLSATIKPIIENEYQQIIKMLKLDFDINFEHEKHQIIYLLTSLNLLINN